MRGQANPKLLGALESIAGDQAMPRANTTQPNIRSAYARHRTREIVDRTGMVTTEIEDIPRGHVPPIASEPINGLVLRGSVLVKPAQGRHVTHDEASQALEAVRDRHL